MTEDVLAEPIRRDRRIDRARHSIENLLDELFRPGNWAAALSYHLGLQGRLVVREETFVLSDESHEPADRAPPPLRIAFASDFHAGSTTHPRLLERACEALTDCEPHVVLLGGDFVTMRASSIHALAQWLAIKDIDGGCQLMAQTLYDDQVFTDADVWRRLRQASELSGKPGERALRGAAQLLGKGVAKEMDSLVDNPARYGTRKSELATARRGEMVTIALARMAANDPAAAALQLQERPGPLAIEVLHRAQVQDRFPSALEQRFEHLQEARGMLFPEWPLQPDQQ